MSTTVDLCPESTRYVACDVRPVHSSVSDASLMLINSAAIVQSDSSCEVCIHLLKKGMNGIISVGVVL